MLKGRHYGQRCLRRILQKESRYTYTTTSLSPTRSTNISVASVSVSVPSNVNVWNKKEPFFHHDAANITTRFFSSDSWNWSKTLSKSSDSDSDTNSTNSSNSSNNNTPDGDQDIQPSIQKQILSTCSSLHASIMPLNESIHGPLAHNSDRGTSLPFVFLVGNHSSGKSSFINHVLGKQVQTAGVAPTDDCFTVICPGPQDSDQDGPALIGDPDMGFAQLRQFGPTLIHHTQLKVRTDINTPSFMMIDSPGMIDSPMQNANTHSLDAAAASTTTAQKNMDRGYDFQGVVRWFGERADVVLLFFDPDKPGTTGESLSVLLHSLSGLDHKLLIVLNKADQFEKIHDFARAYGSLCWNLSKVIPRKDLPKIFTMCLPVQENVKEHTDGSMVQPLEGEGGENPVLGGLADLHQTRKDVVAEVMKAPKRRIDNVITHLHDSIHLLLMHARIAQDVQTRYAKLVWDFRIQELGSLTLGTAFGLGGFYASLPPEMTGSVVGATVLGVGGLKWWNGTKLKETEEGFLTGEELSASFQRTHSREISEADEFAASVWQRIRDSLQRNLKAEGLDNFPKVTDSDVASLKKILEEDIPKLRRMASPQHVGSTGTTKYGNDIWP